MDKLLDKAAKELQAKVEAGTMNGYYSYLGFLADFARSVSDQTRVDDENWERYP